MIRWLPYTFVRITFFLIAGILVALYFPEIFSPRVVAVFLLIAIVSFVAFFIAKCYFNPSSILFAACGFAAIALVGILRVFQSDARLATDYIGNTEKQIESYTVVIDSYVEEKTKTWKVVGRLREIKTDGWEPASGNVLLYFKKTDFEKPFLYGDILLINGRPEGVPGPGNPGEFDYRTFLRYKNIFHQDFLSSEDVAAIGNEPRNFLMKYAIDARVWAREILIQYVPGNQEQSIASALVLGITDGLDNELTHDYAATGAMHVLAVSGLHVSIIYLIIVLILKPLTKTKKGNWLVVLITFAILWCYAFVTGLSPSVLRAVTMFSFMILGKVISRSTNIFNTIAVSAFFLLLFDPYLIMSVGFQLSYLAVLGIVYLQPMVYNWFQFRLWLPDKIWEISAVSIAAQIATFPLGLLYFHQFPNYFLLSNLVVIPLSFAVLILGLALLVASFITPLAVAVGYCVSFFIMLMNAAVSFCESLPFSLIQNINISVIECVLLLVIIVTITLLFRYKRFSYVISLVIFVLLYSVFDWYSSGSMQKNGKLIVYRVPGYTAIDFFEDNKIFTLMDSALIAEEGKVSYHIAPNRIQTGSSNTQSIFTRGTSMELEGARVFIWNGLKILQIFSDRFQLDPDLSPDIVVISTNGVKQFDKLLSSYAGAKEIILDSSNSYRYAEALTKISGATDIPVKSVLSSGAVEINL